MGAPPLRGDGFCTKTIRCSGSNVISLVRWQVVPHAVIAVLIVATIALLLKSTTLTALMPSDTQACPSPLNVMLLGPERAPFVVPSAFRVAPTKPVTRPT